MSKRDVLIIGGGLAGLSAGCYLRANGFRTTIIEHNLALGGVCTAWTRGPYTIDGCLQWLTGGPFDAIYRELGILPRLELRTLNEFATYRDVQSGTKVVVSRDLEALAAQLRDISQVDAGEIDQLLAGARSIARLKPPIDRPQELRTMRQQLHELWDMRHELPAVFRFRKPLGAWAEEHLRSALVRRVLLRLMPGEAPVLFLLMMLGYLEQGYLSRPNGGTRALVGALTDTYRALGGQVLLHSTVEEIIVDGDRAHGVRLSDGEILRADLVISTSSVPETVLRLLGGHYAAQETRARLERWALFSPLVLASYGVALPLADTPSTQIIDGIEPFEVGGCTNDHLMVRLYNDEPSFAPPGHTVVQLMLKTQYTWWATRGTAYNAEKDAIGRLALEQLEPHVPGVLAAVQLQDIATPLTFWNMARSWRGAYEGWIPSPDAVFQHVNKTLTGLDGLYLAGQWVEPGGGIPMALMSGRQVAELVCTDKKVPFANIPCQHA